MKAVPARIAEHFRCGIAANQESGDHCTQFVTNTLDGFNTSLSCGQPIIWK